MPTVCFLDNDAILKLVAANLFWPAISSLGLTQADLRVLPTAKFYFRQSRRLKKVYSESLLQRTLEVVNACAALTPTVDEELQRLQVVEGIDPGEEVLIVATKTEPSFYLVTGDKCCLTALATAGELQDIRGRLKGRVICVEQLTAHRFPVCLGKHPLSLWQLSHHNEIKCILCYHFPESYFRNRGSRGSMKSIISEFFCYGGVDASFYSSILRNAGQ